MKISWLSNKLGQFRQFDTPHDVLNLRDQIAMYIDDFLKELLTGGSVLLAAYSIVLTASSDVYRKKTYFFVENLAELQTTSERLVHEGRLANLLRGFLFWASWTPFLVMAIMTYVAISVANDLGNWQWIDEFGSIFKIDISVNLNMDQAILIFHWLIGFNVLLMTFMVMMATWVRHLSAKS